MQFSKKEGVLIISELIKASMDDGSYKSEAEIARAVGIGPHKLSRWKNGRHPVPSEVCTLALILLDRAFEGERVKDLIDRRIRMYARLMARFDFNGSFEDLYDEEMGTVEFSPEDQIVYSTHYHQTMDELMVTRGSKTQLSRIERVILSLICDGIDSQVISMSMGLELDFVEKKIEIIKEFIGSEKLSSLIKYAIKEGIIEL